MEEQYDSFYRSTRRDLLLQTFALTGDLTAARVAVRDAYVGAWQHWRKVSRLDDPLEWIRPRAWQLAQRRHTGRIWHRNKGLGERHRRVLHALSELPVAHRRVLLLVRVAGLEPSDAARELGVTRETAERELRLATAAYAGALDLPPEDVASSVHVLDDVLDSAALPRGPIVRRSGRKRRQTHTLVGAAAAAVVALASGAFAYEPDATSADSVRRVKPSAEPTQRSTIPSEDDLLTAGQIRRLGPTNTWVEARTDNNTEGDGINTMCQQSRFADPDGYTALVREFRTARGTQRSALQVVEVSRSEKQAAAGFRTAVGWYAGCKVGRLQVLNAYRMGSIGDEAEVLTLKVWNKPVTTMTVAIARLGSVTTTTVSTVVGAPPPGARAVASSLADSVSLLCARTGAESCEATPTFRVAPPPPSGDERGILAVPDLPPVGNIDKPWVGTEPTAGAVNPSRTTCDRANFVKGGATRTRTRTYLIPQASLPARFGLSETYGTFRSVKAASRFLAGVRSTVAGCEKRDLSTTVKSAGSLDRAEPQLEFSSWDLRTEIAEKRFVGFRVGFVRVGRTVAQLTFAPTPEDDMTDLAFRALLVRAGDRLRELDT